jgi:hypothetical protein
VCLGACAKVLERNRFCLDRVEDRFHDRVVVAAHAHALPDTYWLKYRAERMAGVLLPRSEWKIVSSPTTRPQSARRIAAHTR